VSSSLVIQQPAVRRFLPWGLWTLALAIVLAFGLKTGGLGTSPAVLETRQVAVKCPRTKHRLKVEAVLVAPGDQVKAGQVLARMDPSEVDADLAVERAKAQELELQVASLRVKLHDERARTADQLAFDAERASLELARIVSETERDRSELAQLDEALAQEQRLVTEKLANFERLNELKLKRAALSRKVEEYRGTVEKARASADGSARRLDRWRKAVLGTSAESASRVLDQLAPARAAAEAQRERVRREELFRGQLELKAPFDGRIGEVFLRPGDVASSVDQAVLTVVDDRPSMAIAYVEQRWANRIKVGDRAELIPRDRSGPPRVGRVTAVAPSIGELPERFWHFPNMREYGRNVFIKLEAAASLPGQAFDVTFRPGAGAS
jgi:hemolysin D